MDSVAACGHGPVAPSSSGAGKRAVADSRRRDPPYASLRKSADIRRVRRAGTRRRVGGLTLFVSAGEPGPPRVAFVASHNVGSAVRRNRAKRRLREVVRLVGPAGGRDLVVTAGPEVVTAPFATLVAWMKKALEEE
jgi:ribonuclease P protein component